MRRLIVPTAVLAAVATACSVSLGSGGASPGTAQNVALPPVGRDPIVNVVHRVLPAVVNVTTDLFQASPLGGSRTGQGVGTGFIVRSDGVIVTNAHVVEGASGITVFLNGGSGAKYDARVIGGDFEHDLAILKVDAKGLPTVPLGNSDALQLGQRVVALGYALGLTGGPTVTSGIVSSLDRTISARDPGCDPQTCRGGARTYAGVLQTDAAINPGNSGGPLVNLQGQVVGIDTAGSQNAQNIGFAIPIDAAKSTVLHAERAPLAPSAYLGVVTQTVTPDVAFQFNLRVNSGAYVVDTAGGSPADRAGISQGDVIVSVDGHTVGTSDDLGGILAGLKPGARVSVGLVRGGSGSPTSLVVTLGSRSVPTELP